MKRFSSEFPENAVMLAPTSMALSLRLFAVTMISSIAVEDCADAVLARASDATAAEQAM